MNREISAVFFDVGNTLVYPYPSVSEVCHEVLSDAGYERDVSVIDSLLPLVDAYYEDLYRADDSFWADEERTSAVWVGMYSLLCRELGIAEDAVALARRVYDEFGDASRWRLYDDVVPAFRRLSERGLRIGLISNWDGRLARLMDGLGLGDMLDAVVSSAAVGLRKPDSRIFQLACERVGVLPADAAHVGDHHYADFQGASAAGMHAVLIERNGGGSTSGPAAIPSLDTLEEELGL